MLDVSLAAAFVAGMISFFSPCVLPLVPAYLSMVTGVSVDELQDSPKNQRLTILRGTGLFFLGFTVVFIMLGATASAAGSFLLQNKRVFELVSGIIVIVFGIFLIGLIRPGFMEADKRFQVSTSLGGWGAPVLGGAFAFGWTPCIGPILGTVLTLAATQGSIGRGVLLLFFYSLGLGVPFLVTGLALGEMTRLFGWVKRNFRLINAIAGTILIVFGILLITNNVTTVSAWITEWMDRLGLGFLTTI